MRTYDQIITNPPFYPKLPQHPAIREDESIYGYILRLLEVNGFEPSQWMLLKNSFEKRPDDKLLSYLTGYDRSLFSRRDYRYDPKNKARRLLLGDWVHRDLVNSTYSRYCPQCLNEDGYFRMSWDIATTACCPKHEAVLLDHCHSCGKPPKWHRQTLLNCDHCGVAFSKASTEKADPRSVTLTGFLLNKIGLADVRHNDIASFPQAIRFASFGEATAIVQLLLRYKIRQEHGTKPDKPSGAKPEEVHRFLAYIFEILRDWPKGFYYLIESTNSLPSKTATGLRLKTGNLRSLYITLFMSNQDSHFSFLREAFSQYVANNWRGNYLCSRSIVARRMKSPRLVSVMKACEILGVSYDMLRSLRERGEITGLDGNRNSLEGNLYDRQSLLHYRSRIVEGMYLHEILSLFDIDYYTFQCFVKAGLIKQRPAVRLNRAVASGYAKADVHELFQSLTAGTAAISDPLPDHLHWSGAMVALRRIGVDSGKLAKLVLLKRIPVAGTDPRHKGLESILFQRKAISDLHTEARASIETIDYRSRPQIERVLKARGMTSTSQRSMLKREPREKMRANDETEASL